MKAFVGEAEVMEQGSWERRRLGASVAGGKGLSSNWASVFCGLFRCKRTFPGLLLDPKAIYLLEAKLMEWVEVG